MKNHGKQLAKAYRRKRLLARLGEEAVNLVFIGMIAGVLVAVIRAII